jgi:hypothetical protein
MSTMTLDLTRPKAVVPALVAGIHCPIRLDGVDDETSNFAARRMVN